MRCAPCALRALPRVLEARRQHRERLLAAQYLRASTSQQQYALEAQAAAIEAYAQRNGLSIVRTYADPGRSGVSFEGRPGLKALRTAPSFTSQMR